MEASTVNEEAACSLIDSKRIKSRRSGAYLNFWENGGNNAGEAGRDRSWRRATAVLTDGPRTGSQVAGGELHQRSGPQRTVRKPRQQRSNGVEGLRIMNSAHGEERRWWSQAASTPPKASPPVMRTPAGRASRR